MPFSITKIKLDTQHNDTQHNGGVFMLDVIYAYAECHEQTHYAECLYAECRSANIGLV
jgi:hypothetical protein